MLVVERVSIDWGEMLSDMTIDRAIEEILNLKKTYGENIVFRCKYYYDDVEYYLEYVRPETPEEEKKRLINEEKKRIAAEKRKAAKKAKEAKKLEEDRAEYERLKKIFG